MSLLSGNSVKHWHTLFVGGLRLAPAPVVHEIKWCMQGLSYVGYCTADMSRGRWQLALATTIHTCVGMQHMAGQTLQDMPLSASCPSLRPLLPAHASPYLEVPVLPM